MDIYERIKKTAAQKGYSLIALAEKLGITRQSLNYSMKSPSYSTLEKIAAALDVPMWQLFVTREEILSGDSQRQYAGEEAGCWCVNIPHGWDFENTEVIYKVCPAEDEGRNNCFRTAEEAEVMADVIRRLWGYAAYTPAEISQY